MQEVSILGQKDSIMIDESKATALFLEKLKAWQASQEGQTSGYDRGGGPLRKELRGIHTVFFG